METSTTESLGNLDIYNLLSIFDHVNFEGLMNLADSNNNFHQLIKRHYMIPIYRIHELTLAIRGEANWHPSFSSNENLIVLGDPKVIEQFLRLFGDLVIRLEFSAVHYSESQTLTITQYIATYCTKSLLHLQLTEYMKFLITLQQIHFEKLESFALTDVFCKSGPKFEMTFGHLHSIKLNAKSDAKWPIHFIEENVELNSISFPLISGGHVLSLLKHLKHPKKLQELRFDFNHRASNSERDLSEVLHQYSELRRISLTIFDWPNSSENRDAVTQFVQNIWGNCDVQIEPTESTGQSLVSYTRTVNK